MLCRHCPAEPAEPLACNSVVILSVVVVMLAAAVDPNAGGEAKTLPTQAVVASLVELSAVACVVAVVPLAKAVETDHVPLLTCATPVEADVSVPVPPFTGSSGSAKHPKTVVAEFHRKQGAVAPMTVVVPGVMDEAAVGEIHLGSAAAPVLFPQTVLAGAVPVHCA